ncbi:hypothetical protein [Sinomonas atrocyanea]|uniref:hypothetical protein n=1 Tax=Sinomonas atrocyanea TaxID=37927 RepID=UPI0027850828|nr:hypothetical protein [Sinomonas atrocyanea]MDQ0261581.1 hypothetical protein [Sinomonas atrocyanea]MDR6623281.1 hypothetical protein [Sinomonas atrocyanea]
MATKTSTAPSSSDHGSAARIPDAHALGARRGDAADRPDSPVRERLAHPLRPTGRRPVRIPHEVPRTAGTRTTAAANPPSSAGLPVAAPRELTARDLVPPTSLPCTSGDLLGLPDVGALARALRAGWAWLGRQARRAAEVDARLRERREEDSATMARAGVIPGRLM